MRYRRGGYFGEVSLLTGDPRGATVRASGPVRAAFLDWQAFLELPERTRRALQDRMVLYDKDKGLRVSVENSPQGAEGYTRVSVSTVSADFGQGGLLSKMITRLAALKLRLVNTKIRTNRESGEVRDTFDILTRDSAMVRPDMLDTLRAEVEELLKSCVRTGAQKTGTAVPAIFGRLPSAQVIHDPGMDAPVLGHEANGHAGERPTNGAGPSVQATHVSFLQDELAIAREEASRQRESRNAALSRVTELENAMAEMGDALGTAESAAAAAAHAASRSADLMEREQRVVMDVQNALSGMTHRARSAEERAAFEALRAETAERTTERAAMRVEAIEKEVAAQQEKVDGMYAKVAEQLRDAPADARFLAAHADALGAFLSDAVSLKGEGTGTRGLWAARAVSKGEVLVRVPLSAALCARGKEAEAELAVKLAARVTDESTQWPMYAGRVLPSEGEIDSMEGWGVSAIQWQLGGAPELCTLPMGRCYERDDTLAAARAKAGGEHSDERLRWALDCVRSRAFTAVDPSDGERVRVMAPLADLFNHEHALGVGSDDDGAPAPAWRLVEGEDAFEVAAWRDFAAGEEVTLPYASGACTSLELLTSYGFVPQGRNPHERVMLFSSAWDAVLASAPRDSLADERLRLVEARLGRGAESPPLWAAPPSAMDARAATIGVLRLATCEAAELDAFRRDESWGAGDLSALMGVPVGDATRRRAAAAAAARSRDVLQRVEPGEGEAAAARALRERAHEMSAEQRRQALAAALRLNVCELLDHFAGDAEAAAAKIASL